MCNRVAQNDVVIKPDGKAKVLMRGPQGEFEFEFTETVFGGPAKRESRGYWKPARAQRTCWSRTSASSERRIKPLESKDGTMCHPARRWKDCFCRSHLGKITSC